MKKTLSPKDLGRALGISESSLKRWADSGRLAVTRTAGGHRRIPITEAVRFIREYGFAIKRPGVLGFDELESAAPPDGAPTPELPRLRGTPAEAMHEALADGDAEGARAVALAEYLEGRTVAEIVDRLLAPAMREIGERWLHGPKGIEIEHRAAEICSQVLNRLRTLSLPSADAPVAIGGAPPDDPYSLPSQMAASVLASEGWAEINLSAYTPLAVLAQAAADADARLVWLALSLEMPAHQMVATVAELREALDALDSEASVVIGGPALREKKAAGWPRDVYQATSMSELGAFARGLHAASGDRRSRS